jgi:hypothetical protein
MHNTVHIQNRVNYYRVGTDVTRRGRRNGLPNDRKDEKGEYLLSACIVKEHPVGHLSTPFYYASKPIRKDCWKSKGRLLSSGNLGRTRWLIALV